MKKKKKKKNSEGYSLVETAWNPPFTTKLYTSLYILFSIYFICIIYLLFQLLIQFFFTLSHPRPFPATMILSILRNCSSVDAPRPLPLLSADSAVLYLSYNDIQYLENWAIYDSDLKSGK